MLRGVGRNARGVREAVDKGGWTGRFTKQDLVQDTRTSLTCPRVIVFLMDLVELRSQTLGIDALKFGRISSFIDFGNVNYWYEKDQRDADGNTLAEGEKLIVDISKLASLSGE